MSITFMATVTGLKQVRKMLDKATKGMQNATAAAIYQKGLAIMAESKKECPVDKGFLRGSGYVAPPKGGKDPVSEIGYGKKYGPAVHETYGEPRGAMSDAQRKAMFAAIRERGDKPKKGVGKKFFLKDPINRHKSGYTRWIQKRAKEFYRRGIGIGGVSRTEPTKPAENRKG